MIALKDTPNMFVIEKDRTINVIRLCSLGKEQLPSERLELVGLQERILIEVLGVDPPNTDYLNFFH